MSPWSIHLPSDRDVGGKDGAQRQRVEVEVEVDYDDPMFTVVISPPSS